MTTNTTPIPAELSDRELLDATVRAASRERRATVELIALLAEVDERRLHLGLGYSSLFVYCRQVLRLSEHAAYHRIEAARAARRFPVILDLLGDGSVTVTTIGLLHAHLTTDNHADLLGAARHKSKREVEEQVAALAPRLDVRPVVRRVPSTTISGNLHCAPLLMEASEQNPISAMPGSQSVAEQRPVRSIQVVKPIAPTRYVIKVTVSAETHARLRRAQDLLQHKRPGADAAAVIEEALSALVQRLERPNCSKRERRQVGRKAEAPGSRRSRHIPADVRREVWARDEGRCAFEGTHGRCTETGRLEFHHRVPFAEGGATETENLSLRCRAHNAFEGDRWFAP